MGAYNGAVEHRIFVVGIGGEMLEDPCPDPRFRPTAEASMDLDRVAEAVRQVAPGNAGPVAVRHGVDAQAVIVCGHADRTLPSGQEIPDLVPLVVAKCVAVHRSALQS